jgi:hypothetical protein
MAVAWHFEEYRVALWRPLGESDAISYDVNSGKKSWNYVAVDVLGNMSR